MTLILGASHPFPSRYGRIYTYSSMSLLICTQFWGHFWYKSKRAGYFYTAHTGVKHFQNMETLKHYRTHYTHKHAQTHHILI